MCNFYKGVFVGYVWGNICEEIVIQWLKKIIFLFMYVGLGGKNF